MNTKELILAQELVKRYVLDKMSETMTDGQLKRIIAGYGGYETGNGPFWKVVCQDGDRVMKWCFPIAFLSSCQEAMDFAFCDWNALITCVGVETC